MCVSELGARNCQHCCCCCCWTMAHCAECERGDLRLCELCSQCSMVVSCRTAHSLSLSLSPPHLEHYCLFTVFQCLNCMNLRLCVCVCAVQCISVFDTHCFIAIFSVVLCCCVFRVCQQLFCLFLSSIASARCLAIAAFFLIFFFFFISVVIYDNCLSLLLSFSLMFNVFHFISLHFMITHT